MSALQWLLVIVLAVGLHLVSMAVAGLWERRKSATAAAGDEEERDPLDELDKWLSEAKEWVQAARKRVREATRQPARTSGSKTGRTKTAARGKKASSSRK